MVTIEERNYFKIGDEVEFFGPNIDTFSYKITEIYDEDGKILDVANKPKMIIKLPINIKLNKNDIMRVNLREKYESTLK